MQWIRELGAGINALLDPQKASDRIEVAELKAAGVADHTIASLYPQQTFSHVFAIKHLIREPGFTMPSKSLLAEINVERCIKLVPSTRFHIWKMEVLSSTYTSTGTVNFYDKTDPFNWHLIMQLASSESAYLAPLAEQLLRLPIMFDLCGSYTLEPFFWHHDNDQLRDHFESIRAPLEQLRDLTRQYAPTDVNAQVHA